MYSTVFTVELFLLCSQIQQYKAIKYDISPLSPISRHRLNMVRKKVRKSEILQKHCCHEGILAYTNRLGAYTTQPPLSTEFQECHWTSSGHLFISGDTNPGNASVEVATHGVVDVEPPKLPSHTCLLKESFLTQWNHEFPHNLRI